MKTGRQIEADRVSQTKRGMADKERQIKRGRKREAYKERQIKRGRNNGVRVYMQIMANRERQIVRERGRLGKLYIERGRQMESR